MKKELIKKQPNITLKIIFKYRDKILILKLKNKTFDFPGGRLKWKEPILKGLNREIKEELKYSLKEEPKLFDIWNYISKNGKRHSVMIYFTHTFSKKPKLSSLKRTQILWLTKKDFVSMNIIKEKKFINKMFQQ